MVRLHLFLIGLFLFGLMATMNAQTLSDAQLSEIDTYMDERIEGLAPGAAIGVLRDGETSQL